MKPLPYQLYEPPSRLKKARLDNVALVPASLLPFKADYMATANKLPSGSVLCVSGTIRQQKIIESVRDFFKTHGHTVYTLQREQIDGKKPASRLTAETLTLAF